VLVVAERLSGCDKAPLRSATTYFDLPNPILNIAIPPNMIAQKENPKGQTTNRPVLRSASFDDYDEIAAVEEANGLPNTPREKWLHLWQSNPAYQQLYDWPIGWVLEDGSGRVVGSLLNIPCLYRFDRRTYVAAFGRGWVVDVRYRALSLLLIARQSQQPNVDLRLTSTASPKTSAVLTANGWSRVPAGEWDRSAMWVTSYAQTVRRYVAANVPKLAAALAGPLLCAPFLVKDWVSARPARLKGGCELGWCTGFDERFDQFWAELERQNARLLLAIRDRQTLQWHFKYALKEDRIWIVTACDGPRLLGYAILERRDVKSSVKLKRMVLVDLQALAGYQNLAADMISLALDRCRREGIHVFENIGCWLEEQHPLVPRAPYHRKLRNWCYLYRTISPDLADALGNPHSWCPTHYDTDASL
jgi:hypothetical protein